MTNQEQKQKTYYEMANLMRTSANPLLRKLHVKCSECGGFCEAHELEVDMCPKCVMKSAEENEQSDKGEKDE